MNTYQERNFFVGLLNLVAQAGDAAIKEFEAVQQELLLHKTASITDGPTGLINKSRIGVELDYLFHDALRANKTASVPQALAVIAFDIDYFKKVNDVFGHATGDEVIKAVAAQAKDTFQRYNDVVARDNGKSQQLVGRDGGEEFLVAFVCDADKADASAKIMGERLRAAVEKNCAIREDGSVGAGGKIARPVTISGGIAILTPGEEHRRGGIDIALARLKKEADDALYAGKRDGRNRIYLAAETKAAPAPAMRERQMAAAGPDL